MALREVLANFDVKVDLGALNAATRGIDKLTGGIKNAVAGLFAGALFTGLKGLITGLAETGDQITDTAAQLGLNRTELQEWQLAAKLSGAEASDLATSIKILQKNVDGATTAGSSQAKVFKSLGVEIREANGKIKPTGDLLAETGIAIAKMPDPTARTAKALEVFGKAGTKLLPMFDKGEEGLQALLGELEKLGGGYSEDALDAMGDLGDNMDRFGVATDSLKSVFAARFLPALTAGLQKLTVFSATVATDENAVAKLRLALGVLGVIGLAAGVKMLAPFVPMALIIAAIVIVVDELWTTLNGGDSYLRDFLDKVFGKENTDSVFAMIKNDLEDLKKEIQAEPKGGRSGVEITFDRIGASLRKFPGEVQEMLTRMTAQVDKGTATTFEKIATIPFRMGRAIGEGLKALSEGQAALESAVNMIPSKVGKILTQMTDLSHKVGGSIPEGLAKGIEGGLETVKNAAFKLGQTVKAPLVGIIKPGSPSRMAADLAATIPPGLSNAMLAGRGQVSSASASLAGTIPGAILPPIERSSRVANVNSTTNNQITVHGIGADAVRRGVMMSGEESRRATYAAVTDFA